MLDVQNQSYKISMTQDNIRKSGSPSEGSVSRMYLKPEVSNQNNDSLQRTKVFVVVVVFVVAVVVVFKKTFYRLLKSILCDSLGHYNFHAEILFCFFV